MERDELLQELADDEREAFMEAERATADVYRCLHTALSTIAALRREVRELKGREVRVSMSLDNAGSLLIKDEQR